MRQTHRRRLLYYNNVPNTVLYAVIGIIIIIIIESVRARHHHYYYYYARSVSDRTQSGFVIKYSCGPEETEFRWCVSLPSISNCVKYFNDVDFVTSRPSFQSGTVTF